MSLNLWWPEDVARVLAALAQATARDIQDPVLRQMRLNALADVAVAFGLQPPRLQDAESDRGQVPRIDRDW